MMAEKGGVINFILLALVRWENLYINKHWSMKGQGCVCL